MFSKIIKRVLILTLVVAGLSAPAAAQDKISPAKRALIKELLGLSNVQKEMDTIMKFTFDRYEQEAPKRIAEQVEQMESLNPEDREKIRQDMLESTARYSKRFREAIQQQLNLGAMVEGVLYPLYDKYFTEEDLKAQIDFLKSPAGRKMLEIMPQAMTEAMVKMDEVLQPKIEEITKQILEEEKKNFPQ